MLGRRALAVAALLGFGTVAVLLLADGIVGWLQVTGPAKVPVPDDVLVYCLSPVRRQEFIDAANVLGLASPGRTADSIIPRGGGEQPVDEWRTSHPQDFARTCQALESAGSRTGLVSTGGRSLRDLLVLLPALMGAALTYFFMEWREIKDRRRTLAGRLRGDSVEFRSQVSAISQQRLEAVTARPAITDLRRVREALASQIGKILYRHPDWTLAGRIAMALSEDDVDVYLERVWPGSVADRRLLRRAAVDWATALEASIDTLADAVEKPVMHAGSARRPHGCPPRLRPIDSVVADATGSAL